MSQRTNSPLLIRGKRAFKTEFQGCIGMAGGGEGSYVQNSTVNTNSHLEIGHVVV